MEESLSYSSVRLQVYPGIYLVVFSVPFLIEELGSKGVGLFAGSAVASLSVR